MNVVSMEHSDEGQAGLESRPLEVRKFVYYFCICCEYGQVTSPLGAPISSSIRGLGSLSPWFQAGK